MVTEDFMCCYIVDCLYYKYIQLIDEGLEMLRHLVLWGTVNRSYCKIAFKCEDRATVNIFCISLNDALHCL